ncbi:MAG: hypothetical protein A7315_03985 [Candidatus Altiarchaeales archaeon WOR_SM1_79]|nr:MAG: hypothetical protein A7315_03985 [Candidatus Altiarchaeales archaeon WOR_SM1_79]
MKTEINILYETVVVISCVFLIAFLWSDNALLLSISLLVCSIALYIWHREKSELLLFIMGAIFGPVVEVICIYYGAWSYSNPSFLGIPIWLPIAWGYAVVYLKGIHENILGVKK